MKRFDQWSQGHKKSETPNSQGEKKGRNPNKKSLDDTKKHLGFQWDASTK